MRANGRGEEAGAQNLDLMNKNCVERHGMPGELATGSKAQRGSKQIRVNAARVRGKNPYLIRGDLLVFFQQKSAAAVVVGGVTTIRGGW